jgi:hypothetical protein
MVTKVPSAGIDFIGAIPRKFGEAFEKRGYNVTQLAFFTARMDMDVHNSYTSHDQRRSHGR